MRLFSFERQGDNWPQFIHGPRGNLRLSLAIERDYSLTTQTGEDHAYWSSVCEART